MEKRFENLDDFMALNLFNVSLWNNLNEDDVELMKLDSTKLDELAVIMKTPLDMHTFDLKEAKKEWKKVKRIVKCQYLHLQDRQVNLWSNFIHSHDNFLPNISFIIEMFLVMLCSSSVVERGFSTCRRNLPATRSSLKNDRLNNILLIKNKYACVAERARRCRKVGY